MVSAEMAKKRQTIQTRFSKREIDSFRILGLLKPIVDYSSKEDPEYNHAVHLEAFTENLEKEIASTELAERIGVKTTSIPRFYDRRLHQSLFKFKTVKKQRGGRPKVIVSLDDPLKQILRLQVNFSNIMIPFEDLKPYAELRIRLSDGKSCYEESAEAEKALDFLVQNSSFQGMSSLIMKHNGEAYLAEKGQSHVSYVADLVQFSDNAQRFFEPIVYTGEAKAPNVEIDGKPYKGLGFKFEEKPLRGTHFNLPKTFTLDKTGIPNTVPFTQHYYCVSSFRPLQVYSLRYSQKGMIPVCIQGTHVFLCFDFWLAYEESKFTMKWEQTLPISPAKDGFVSVITPEWMPAREEGEQEVFMLGDKTQEIGVEPRHGTNVCEVKTKAGKTKGMGKLFVQSRVAKPPWRIRFKFIASPQPVWSLTYRFKGSCENCPLLTS